MLAKSSYRHQVEADIEPFRGLLMGLFFVAVDLSLDLRAVADNWLIFMLAVPVTVALKGIGAYAVNRAFRTAHPILKQKMLRSTRMTTMTRRTAASRSHCEGR